MADPLSVASAVMGIAAVSCQIIQLVTKFGLDWKDAPKDISAYHAELQSLDTLSKFLSTELVCNPDLIPNAAETQSLVDACRLELDKLFREIGNLRNSKNKRPGWAQLKATFKAKRLRDAMNNLQRQYNVMNQIVNVGSAAQGRKLREEIVDMRQDQLDAEILDWLSTSNVASQVQDLLNRRVGETGKWLVETSIFKQWDEGDESQILLCQGIPGSGKTVMASIVSQYLQDKYEDDDVGFACFFCDFRRHVEQNISKFLLSLLCQLVEQRGFVPESIKNWYAKFKKRRSLPSLSEIVQTLHTVADEFDKLYVVVDALDEWQGEDSDEDIFEALRKLQTEAGARVFLTSRVIPLIKDEFQGSMFLEIYAHEEDLRMFIESRLDRGRLKKFQTLFGKIKDEVVKAADGMFLLAELHIRTLESKITRGSIEDTLENLPQGPAGLHVTYDQAMKRIGMDRAVNAGDGEYYAQKGLEWVIYARRPLSSNEFLHAISVEEGASDLDERDVPDLDTVLSFCGGFLTVDQGSNIIRLIHYTAQEYFDKTGASWFPLAARNVAQTCITYLSFDTFGAGPCPSDSEYEARLQAKPLYSYCSRNWGHHVSPVLAEITETVKRFLSNGDKVSSSAQLLMALGTLPGYSRKAPREFDGLHLAALFGINDLVQLLLNDGHDASVKDSFGWTPLMWAAANGQEGVVLLLLETGVDVNAADGKNQNVLHAAIWGLHIDIVRVLLRWNADTQIRDYWKRGALDVAAEVGSKEILRLLLQSRCPTISDGKPGDGSLDVEKLLAEIIESGLKAKLESAIEDGRAFEVKTLLQVDPSLGNHCDGGLQSMLNRAAFFRHESVLQVLLDAGADANGADEVGHRALQLAVSSGRDSQVRQQRLPSVISLLLSFGADIRAVDGDGRSVFHQAAMRGDLAALKHLVDITPIGLDEPDLWGMTPLMLAAAHGRTDVIRFLIQDHGVDPNRRNHEGQTALLCAVSAWVPTRERGSNWAGLPRNACEIYSALTEASSIEVNARDNHGRTALTCVLKKIGKQREELIISLLLEAGATVDSNSLCMAVEIGNASAVSHLLQHGARVGIEDALEMARMKQFPEIVTLLLNYVEVAPPQFANWLVTAQLSEAVRGGDARMVESLIAQGADVVTASSTYDLLRLAIEGEHTEIFSVLVSNGALNIEAGKLPWLYLLASKAQSPDFLRTLVGSCAMSEPGSEPERERGRARCSYFPICLVCCVVGSGMVERLQLLLDWGVDLTCFGGSSPIFAALKRWNLEMLEYLVKHGVDVNYRDGDGMTALHQVDWGNEGAGRVLVAAGADIEAREGKGRTPLGSALAHSRPKQVKALLELGADPHNVQLDSIEFSDRYGELEEFREGMRLVRRARHAKR